MGRTSIYYLFTAVTKIFVSSPNEPLLPSTTPLVLASPPSKTVVSGSPLWHRDLKRKSLLLLGRHESIIEADYVAAGEDHVSVAVDAR